MINLKRVSWAVVLGIGGLCIGGVAGGSEGSLAGFLWGACIGYGFGSIFDTRQAAKRLVVYWGITLALIGISLGVLFGVPAQRSETVAGAIGGGLGALCGSLIGVIQLLWRRHRKSQAQHSDSAD